VWLRRKIKTSSSVSPIFISKHNGSVTKKWVRTLSSLQTSYQFSGRQQLDPLIQINSDTIYRELVSNTTGWELSLHLRSQLQGQATGNPDQPAMIQGSHDHLCRSNSFAEAALRTHGNTDLHLLVYYKGYSRGYWWIPGEKIVKTRYVGRGAELPCPPECTHV
jgi:hypothetical protein